MSVIKYDLIETLISYALEKKINVSTSLSCCKVEILKV